MNESFAQQLTCANSVVVLVDLCKYIRINATPRERIYIAERSARDDIVVHNLIIVRLCESIFISQSKVHVSSGYLIEKFCFRTAPCSDLEIFFKLCRRN